MTTAEHPPIHLSRPVVGEAERRGVDQVLKSGILAQGPVTAEFESTFAKLIGTKHAIAVNSGTAALHVAMEAAGIGRRHKVAVPCFTFVASANSILMSGARPTFIDVDEHGCMDPLDLEAQIKAGEVDAVMPVHLYGRPADMNHIIEVAGDRPIIEDAAQAHGAAIGDRPVGSIGTAGCFSMYPTKNMTSAEGGMITTNDEDLAELAQSLRNHGRGEATLGTYDHIRMGYNFRTSDVHSAIGLAQLGRIEGFNNARNRNAEHLRRGLTDVQGLIVPARYAQGRHAWHQFTVRVQGGSETRDAFVNRLRNEGIGCNVYYPKLASEYPHLREFARTCPKGTTLTQEVVSLPVHPGLSSQDLNRVIDVAARAME